MQKFKADLHIHTVLSPCADLEMSPKNIVRKAFEKGLNIIGITDHNSTLQCKTVKKIASDYGIMVLTGAEVTSREDVHNLVFFENDEKLAEFQEFIERKQKKIKNDPLKFGFQAVVNENDVILQEIDNYLGMALDAGIDEIEEKVHNLNGLYIPAHIDRVRYSLISQLGFVPDDIKADALEIYNRTSVKQFLTENNYLSGFTFIRDSDSHYIDNVGQFYNIFHLEELSFKEIRMALKNKNKRRVEIDEL